MRFNTCISTLILSSASIMCTLEPAQAQTVATGRLAECADPDGDGIGLNQGMDDVPCATVLLGNQENLEALDAVSDIQEDVSDLDTSVSTAETNIASNSAQITANETNIGNNADQISLNQNNISNNTDQINSMSNGFNRLENNISTNRQIAADGIAIALAAKVPTLTDSQLNAFSVGLGHYDGSSALAIAGATKIENSNATLFGTLGVGIQQQKFGFSAGMQWAW